jgi:type VI secretion system VasD/TssJ family lipoprotein
VGRVQVEADARGMKEMKGTKWWWAAVAAVALSAASSGCATCKTPPPFFVELTAGRDTNGGAATRVLVLQLKALDALQVADFNEVRKNPQGALGETMVGKPEEIWVNANESEVRWLARDKDARFIAAVAVFQNPSQKWWSSHGMKTISSISLQCREVAVESFQGRRPYSSEEQMRFILGTWDITTEREQQPASPPPAESARRTARPGEKGA